jgi:type II secretory pathway component PulF
MEIIQVNIPDIPVWKSVFKVEVPTSTVQPIINFIQKNWVWLTALLVTVLVFITVVLYNRNKRDEDNQGML